MDQVRPLRDVFADLTGTDAGQARAALAAAGHDDLPDDLLRTAIEGYAGTAPAEVAEHLSAADGPDDGLALLASAPAGPWDGEVALDPADDLTDGLPAGDDLDAADLLDVPHGAAGDDVATAGPADPDDHLRDDDPADHAFGAGDDGDGPDDTLDGADDLDTLDHPGTFGTAVHALDAPVFDDHSPEADDGFDDGLDDGFGAGSATADLLDDAADAGSDGPQADDVHDAG